VLRVPALVPGAVEFDRVVPASGNLAVAGKQFWLGPDRAGITVSFWADHDVIHLLVAVARIKSVRSHLSTADLQRLGATGGRPAGPPPLPAPDGDGAAVEVDRVVSAGGTANICSCAMALRWTRQWGGTFRGWDGESLAADVVPYRDWHLTEPGPDGLRRVEITGTHWRARTSPSNRSVAGSPAQTRRRRRPTLRSAT
jgi:hypothetical protein